MGERRSTAKPPSPMRQQRDGVVTEVRDKPIPWHLWEYVPAEDITVHRREIATVKKPLDTIHGQWLSEEEHNARLEEDATLIRRAR